MFTVGWVRSALDDLAEMWNRADAGDRAAIAWAANTTALTFAPAASGQAGQLNAQCD